MRRIVTGHNSDGKSVITLDGPPARSIGEDVGGLFEALETSKRIDFSAFSAVIETGKVQGCWLQPR